MMTGRRCRDMIANELVEMMKEFLEGNMSAEDFSFDFPARLAYVTDQLDKENPALSELLNEDMPETCCNFEPDEEERKSYPEIYLSERQMRKKTDEVYHKALKLVSVI